MRIEAFAIWSNGGQAKLAIAGSNLTGVDTCGHATRLYVAHSELERYRKESLGAQGWDKRREPAPPAIADASRSR